MKFHRFLNLFPVNKSFFRRPIALARNLVPTVVAKIPIRKRAAAPEGLVEVMGK
jgi:hypothetical protein